MGQELQFLCSNIRALRQKIIIKKKKTTNGNKVSLICKAQVDLRIQNPRATVLLLLVSHGKTLAL